MQTEKVIFCKLKIVSTLCFFFVKLGYCCFEIYELDNYINLTSFSGSVNLDKKRGEIVRDQKSKIVNTSLGDISLSFVMSFLALIMFHLEKTNKNAS